MYFQQIFCGCGEKDWGKTEYCLMKPRLMVRHFFEEERGLRLLFAHRQQNDRYQNADNAQSGWNGQLLVEDQNAKHYAGYRLESGEQRSILGPYILDAFLKSDDCGTADRCKQK